jgi:DNA-binding transcriptional regulator/RsmH inhibitor MraZ
VEQTPQEHAVSAPPLGRGGENLPLSPAVELPLGTFAVKTDDKGRIKVPVKFQEYLQAFPGDGGLFVTSLDRRTVSIYPVRVWRENLKKFKEYRGDPAAVKVVQFNANDLGTEEKMDSQARLTLNSELRAALGLEDKTTLHMQGRNGHIELITDDVYQEMRARALREAAAAAEKLLGEGFE